MRHVKGLVKGNVIKILSKVPLANRWDAYAPSPFCGEKKPQVYPYLDFECDTRKYLEIVYMKRKEMEAQILKSS